MWTFDNPPTRLLQDKFGYVPSADWLDRLRLSSVRFNDGGSGAFVSAEGLTITNHHVGLACIQNVSTAEHDYVKDGFYAPTREREMACPGYEVNVLVKIEDVTGRVLGRVSPAMNDKEAGDARKAATARVEHDCNVATGLRCDVVKLYHGGEYHLYHYKKYTDVRLVFAPEQRIAFFGGDFDNFTYPRHALSGCAGHRSTPLGCVLRPRPGGARRLPCRAIQLDRLPRPSGSSRSRSSWRGSRRHLAR
jgi:hypothetical protein